MSKMLIQVRSAADIEHGDTVTIRVKDEDIDYSGKVYRCDSGHIMFAGSWLVDHTGELNSEFLIVEATREVTTPTAEQGMILIFETNDKTYSHPLLAECDGSNENGVWQAIGAKSRIRSEQIIR